jgi:peptidoglycan/xylan/chitin deacetylase (PgdA/CDA1 family)
MKIKIHPPTYSLFFILLLVNPLMAFQVFAGEDCNAVRAQYQCPVKTHRLHLSFDDGVGSVTPKILDELKRENIKATFLILGNKVDCKQYKPGKSLELCKQRFNTLKRIKSEGHDIGSHSYQHYHHSKLSLAELNKTILDSKKILEPFFTTQPPVFRLPYGDGWFNQKDQPQVMEALKKAGFEHLGWEMTAYDWNEKYQHGDQILDNVMGQMCKGRGRDGVVLFHDGVFENEHEGRVFTANNLARWIPKLRCAADFVPLTDVKKNFKKR